MNILLISPLPPPYGGIARWSETVIRYCDSKKIKLTNINTGNNVQELNQRTKSDRYLGSMLRMLKASHKIKKTVKEMNYDVAHITTSSGFGTIRDIVLMRQLRRQNIPIIYHLHYGRYRSSKELNNIEHKLMKKSLPLADKIIAIDPLTYETLKEEYNNVYFVPNPVEKVEYHYSNKKEIIFLGYVVPSKGVEELLKAWENLKKKYPEWILKICGQGKGEYIQKLKDSFNCEDVQFCGELPHDVAMEQLKQASIFVLPSYSEGFPYSVCEAMFAGKAIVATNVGSIPYQLENESGIVCESRNYESLLSALDPIMSNEKTRNKLSLNANSRVNENFSVPVIMNQYMDLWSKCNNDKSKRIV